MSIRQKTKLKDIAYILSGIYEKNDKDGDVAYLQTKDCGDSVVMRYASHVLLNTKTRKNLLQQNDILFACKGMNYLCTVYQEKEKAVASTSFFVIRLKSDALSPEYLCWFLRLPATEGYFKTCQVGSATPLIVEIARLAQRERHLQETIIKRKQLILQQLLMNKTI